MHLIPVPRELRLEDYKFLFFLGHTLHSVRQQTDRQADRWNIEEKNNERKGGREKEEQHEANSESCSLTVSCQTQQRTHEVVEI